MISAQQIAYIHIYTYICNSKLENLFAIRLIHPECYGANSEDATTMPFKDLTDLVGQLSITDDVIVMERKFRDLADYCRPVFEDREAFK